MNSTPEVPAALVDRARSLGVLPVFDADGTPHHASAATLEAVCAALEPRPTAADSPTPNGSTSPAQIPPSLVFRASRGHRIEGISYGATAELECESGERFEFTAAADAESGSNSLTLPPDLPLGYHRLRISTPDSEAVQHTHVIVCPDTAPQPQASPGMTHCPGIQVQLYQVISARSWGLGDFADLRGFAVLAAERLQAGFVVVNPLNAAAPTLPVEASPYLPTTREFLSALYIAPEEAPGAASLQGEEAAAFRAAQQRAQATLGGEQIDRDAVWAAKQEALRLCFDAVVHESPDTAELATAAAVDEPLRRFATWCALATHLGPQWHSWPEELQHPDSPEVADYFNANLRTVSFFVWLEFVAREQLEAAHQAACAAGMPLGIITDLPVGIHPEGADAWAMPESLARGVTVGAPPDMFNQQGQDWSQPPLRPDALARQGYEPFARLVRAALRHAGGLRIDHILGLGRLWWIPEGMSAAAGAYVTYDLQAMLGVLALEAHRAEAIVIGEDLGMVDPNTRTALAEWGVLGTSIVWFEHDTEAEKAAAERESARTHTLSSRQPPETTDEPVIYLAPERYRAAALTTVTTHDLPPTAGFLAGDHVRVRAELGALTQPVATELAAGRRDAAAMLHALYQRGLLSTDLSACFAQSGCATASTAEHTATEPLNTAQTWEVTRALHAFCAASPAVLVAASLVDLVGERRAINIPGTSIEYPNWCLFLCDADGNRVTYPEALCRNTADDVFAPLRNPQPN